MVAYRLGQHSFANTRRSVEQDALPWFYLALLKYVGAQHRQNKSHIYDFLGVIAACNVGKANVWLCVQDAFFKRILHFSVIFRRQFSVHVQSNLE